MSDHDRSSETPTPLRVIRQGSINLEDRLESIEAILRQILEKENATTTDVALIQAKLALHDMILMGVCGVVGSALLIAITIKVIH